MACFLIAVIDRSCARLFTFEESDFPEQSPPALVERSQLHNKSARQNADALWSDTQAGSNRSVASHTYSYDDRRDHHLLEFERRFIEAVASKLLMLNRLHQPSRLILVAESQVLGIVRKVISTKPDLRALECCELNKDLGYFTTPEIRQYLADKSLISSPYRPIT